MAQVKAPIVKDGTGSADKSIWEDGEEALDEEVGNVLISLRCHSPINLFKKIHFKVKTQISRCYG